MKKIIPTPLLSLLFCVFAVVWSIGAEGVEQCQLSATLQGDAAAFWVRGTDSWSGAGTIQCDKKVHVIFIYLSSWLSGQGTYADDTVELKISSIPAAQAGNLYASFRVFREALPAVNAQQPLAQLLASTQNVDSQSVNWTIDVRVRNPERGFNFLYGLMTISPLKAAAEGK